MRILLLGNNRVALEIVRFLKAEHEDIVALALHPPERARYRQEIVEVAGLAPDAILDGSRLDEAASLAHLRELRPEVGISAYFGYILRRPFLQLFASGCLNVHPSFLPFNRGAHPNVWSILDGTPAGATLHYIDEGVDTGEIVAQKRVMVEPVDTGQSLYSKLEAASIDLFRNTWPLIRSNSLTRAPNRAELGTCHRVRDLASCSEIDLDRMYSGRQLIDLLRARTFPPHAGAYFRAGDRKVHMDLTLTYGE